jgi:hypothetical protein
MFILYSDLLNKRVMKKIKNYAEKLDSYAEIISLLSNNNEIPKKISRFQIAVEQLNSNQKNLMELYPLLNKDITSSEKVKNKRRVELIEKHMPVIRIMQAFAFDKKKKNLQKQVEYLTADYVQNCSDNELIKISKKIWLIATKNAGYATTYTDKIKSTLNPNESKAIIKFKKEYGLKPEMIKNIEESNIKFIESLLIYKAEMKEKEKIAMKMKKINKQTKNLLCNKIDRFVLLFERENPSFFNDYSSLRENQESAELAETLNQEANPQNLSVAEKQVNTKEPKTKPKIRKKTVKPQSPNPEKN